MKNRPGIQPVSQAEMARMQITAPLTIRYFCLEYLDSLQHLWLNNGEISVHTDHSNMIRKG